MAKCLCKTQTNWSTHINIGDNSGVGVCVLHGEFAISYQLHIQREYGATGERIRLQVHTLSNPRVTETRENRITITGEKG